MTLFCHYRDNSVSSIFGIFAAFSPTARQRTDVRTIDYRRSDGDLRVVLHVKYNAVFALVELLKVRTDLLNFRHRNQL